MITLLVLLLPVIGFVLGTACDIYLQAQAVCS